MYRFSLETVLKHRKHTEEVLQKAFVDKKRELLMAEESLASLEAVKMKNLSALHQKQQDGAGIWAVVLYDNYIRQISIKLSNQSNRIKELKHELSANRKELIEAMKRRKTLDRLKEKKWEAYKKTVERKEQIFLGETAINGFHRTNYSS